MTPDEQEALSLAYAFGVRLIQLSSGAWAHFSNRTLICILPEIDTLQCQLILEDQHRAYEAEIERARRKSAPKLRLSGEDLLKELGL